ncbi:hypothetical protein KP509_13G086500 [Ceratopteris richardii]|uniref:Reverse transcriptase RNase H-like domain-containing protein n=1 Tax=Ceratopteris richardii TaxID=49495 RepID=A0A8T2THQ0_CERRI|nr:hypothetical protein KP509_13G086500 [Ceratopteris richardii]
MILEEIILTLRELWRLFTALKTNQEYFMGANVIVETDSLPLIGLIANCSSPDIAMLRWITFIKFINPTFLCIAEKHNTIVDMLSREKFDDDREAMDKHIDLINYETSTFMYEIFRANDFEGE